VSSVSVSRRARGIDERRHVTQRRASPPRELDVTRQHDRELLVWHRHRATALAVHDRDRCAPIALARDEPVAQAIYDRGAADAALLRFPRDVLFALFAARPRERPAPDHASLPDVGRVQAVVLVAIG